MTPFRWGALVLGIFAVVILGTVGGVYLAIDHTPAPKSASYLPPGTQAYFSINIDPDSGQTANLKAIYARFKAIPGFDEKLREYLAFSDPERADRVGKPELDLEKDILAWLGPEIAVGLLSFEGLEEVPEAVAFVGTANPDATKGLIERLPEFGLEGTLETGEYGRYVTYTVTGQAAPDEAAYMAVTDQYLVIAAKKALLESTIDMMERGGPSLADDPRFQRAQAAVEDPRFAFLFVDTKALADAQRQMIREGGAPGLLMGAGGLAPLLAASAAGTPEYLAASATAMEGALRVFASSPTPEDAPVVSWSNPVESANRVPADTVALVSVGGVQEGWEQFQEQLSAAPGAGTSDLQIMLKAINQGLGFDLQQDLLSWMSGEAAIALLSPVENDGDAPVLHALALLEYDDESAVREGLGKALSIFEALGAGEPEQTRLNGVEATLFDVGHLLPGYSPGYVLLDGYVALGATAESLEKFIAASNGDLPSLAESPGFARLRDQAGIEADTLVYVSLEAAVASLAALGGPEGLADYEEEAAPLLEPFGDLIFVAGTSATSTTMQAGITFE